MTIETLLYHGSGFDQEELMPGFLRTGKIVRWDEVESNEWLYTTTSKEEAISQAFASMIEKTYGSVHYQTEGNHICIGFEGEAIPTLKELEQLVLWLYTIRLDEADEWQKNANEHNQIKTEWKTQSIVKDSIIGKERIKLQTGGRGKNKPNYLAW
jgi:hypothetical protein